MATWRGSVNTLVELQALDTTFLNENLVIFVKDQEKWYFWDSTSSEAISSPDVVGRSQGLLSTSLVDANVFLELEETGQPFVDILFNSNFNEQANTVVNQVTGKRNNAIELTASGSEVGIIAVNKFEAHTNQDSTINFWWKWTDLPGNQFSGTIVEVVDSYKLEYIPGSFRQTTDDGVGTSNDLESLDPVFAGFPLSDFVMTTILWDHKLRRTTILFNLVGATELETTVDPQVQAGNNLQLFPDSTDGDHAVDHLGIWPRILTPREIRLLYEQGNAYPVNAVDFATGRWKTVGAGGAVTDELVKITTNDTTPDFLQPKLVAGTNVTLNLLNPAANEQIEIVSQDELAKVSSNDTTSDYLLNKLVSGLGVTLTEIDDGSNETLEISSTAANNLTVKQEFVGTTPSIADLASADITIASARALMIGRVETDVPATVRLYSSIAARTADAIRPLGTPPAAGTEGLVTEVQTTGGNLEIDLSDAVNHVNLEGTQLSEIYATVFNESGGNSAVQVTLCAHVIGNVIVTSGDSQTFSETTASIPDLASANISIASDKALLIGRISADFASTIRLYNSIAARTADSGRALGAAPTPTTEGLIAEVAPTGGNLDIDLSPSIGSVNLEDPQTQDIYATVFNQSGGNQAITVTIIAHPVGSGGSGGGGSIGIQNFAGSTTVIADSTSEDIDITTGALTKLGIARIQTSVAALIRLYTSKANRTADAGRGIGVPAPASIRGLVAEIETSAVDLIIDLSNLPTHINLENTQVPEIYATVFNLSGVNNVVTLTIYGE